MIELLASIDVTALLFGSFILLLILGVPIGHALGAATLLVLYAQGIPGVFLPQTAFNTTDSFPLVAVPFFVLAGYLMEFGGLSLRLVNLASAVIGHVTGGFACVTILACMFFAAMSGSGPATVAAIGTLMIPAMTRVGYKPRVRGRRRVDRRHARHHDPAEQPDDHLRRRRQRVGDAALHRRHRSRHPHRASS